MPYRFEDPMERRATELYSQGETGFLSANAFRAIDKHWAEPSYSTGMRIFDIVSPNSGANLVMEDNLEKTTFRLIQPYETFNDEGIFETGFKTATWSVGDDEVRLTKTPLDAEETSRIINDKESMQEILNDLWGGFLDRDAPELNSKPARVKDKLRLAIGTTSLTRLKRRVQFRKKA